MPKIGMRIWKSALAVFLCFLINDFRQGGIVFYSIIAAVLCMQPSVSQGLKTGQNRIVGTLIGGLSGMLVLWLELNLMLSLPDIVIQLATALCVVPLIYINVLLKSPSSSYITCVVFMSIVVSHGADLNPFLFGFNRILDTLIGIGVSLLVNLLIAPKKTPTEISGALGDQKSELSTAANLPDDSHDSDQ